MSPSFHQELDPDVEERLWAEGTAALDGGNHERAIELFKVLAEAGDWRASVSLGYIFEARGKDDRPSYVVAAHWYSRSLSQEERPEGHLALARYHYFGLGENRDLARAFEHLMQVPIERDPQVALMLGELYFLGLGVSKDLGKARWMFSALADRGLPVGFLNLSRLEKVEGHPLRYWVAYFRGLLLVGRIASKNGGNRDDRRLIGLGGARGKFRLDHLVAQEAPAK